MLICLFLLNDISYSLDLKSDPATSTLAPTSRFSPISLKWDSLNEKYIINVDNELKGETNDWIALTYLSVLIGQFLQQLGKFKDAEISGRGIDRHVELFKESIEEHFPYASKKFGRFHFNEMRYDGNSISVPYERKDDASKVQALKYYLSDAKRQSRSTQYPDKIFKLEFPLDASGAKVVLEDSGAVMPAPEVTASVKTISIPGTEPTRPSISSSEFFYYTHDENGALLKEPCGFPGKWTVEVRDSQGELDNSAVLRLTKSFSLASITAGRSDLQRAKFTVVALPKPTTKNILAAGDEICIEKSDVFGINVIVTPAFTRFGMAKQREIFGVIIPVLPNIETKVLNEVIDNTSDEKQRKIKVLLFSNIFNDDDNQLVSPSLLSLYAMLAKMGMEVTVNPMNLSKKPDEIVHERFKQDIQNADMVCLTVFHEDLKTIKKLSELLKQINPNIKIAVGGHAITMVPEHITARLPHVDVFYRGEAEAGFENVVNGIGRYITDGKANAESISGAFEGAAGTIIKLGNIYQINECMTVNRINEDELNKRSFDFSRFDELPFNTFFSFMTSYGCPHNCKFCGTAGGKMLRAMYPEKVIEVLWEYDNYLRSRKARGLPVSPKAYFVKFTDDNFLYDPARALNIFELFRQAIDKGLSLRLAGMEGTITSLLTRDEGGKKRGANEELIDALSGYPDIFYNDAVTINLGCDALIDEEVKRLGKGPYSTAEAEDVLRACSKYGIVNPNFLILTNSKTSTRDLLLTFLKVYELESKYPYTDLLHSASLNAPGINPSDGTSAVNDLIREGKEYLLPSDGRDAETALLGSFPEYVMYGNTDGNYRFISSENLPRDAIDEIKKLHREIIYKGDIRTQRRFVLKYIYGLLKYLKKKIDHADPKEMELYNCLSDKTIDKELDKLNVLPLYSAVSVTTKLWMYWQTLKIFFIKASIDHAIKKKRRGDARGLRPVMWLVKGISFVIKLPLMPIVLYQDWIEEPIVSWIQDIRDKNVIKRFENYNRLEALKNRSPAPVSIVPDKKPSSFLQYMIIAAKVITIPLICMSVSYYFRDLYMFIIKYSYASALALNSVVGMLSRGSGSYISQTLERKPAEWQYIWRWALWGGLYLGFVVFGAWYTILEKYVKSDVIKVVLDITIFALFIGLPSNYSINKYLVYKSASKRNFKEWVIDFFRLFVINAAWWGIGLYFAWRYVPDYRALIAANMGVVWSGILIYLLNRWFGHSASGKPDRDEDADITIASGGYAGLTRRDHDDYHGNISIQMVKIANRLERLAYKHDIELEQYIHRDTVEHYDIRSVVTELIKRTHRDRVVLNNVDGREVSIWVEKGILVIENPNFSVNHAGRNEMAVYARDGRGIAHEMRELSLWRDFAMKPSKYGVYDMRIVRPGSDIGIKQSWKLLIGDRIMEWANKTIEKRMPVDNKPLAARFRREFHQLACQAEFSYVLNRKMESGDINPGLIHILLKKLGLRSIEYLMNNGMDVEIIEKGEAAKDQDLLTVDILANKLFISESCLAYHMPQWFEYRILTYVHYRRLLGFDRRMAYRLAAEVEAENRALFDVHIRCKPGERFPPDIMHEIRRFGQETTNTWTLKQEEQVFEYVKKRFLSRLTSEELKELETVSDYDIYDIFRDEMAPKLDERLAEAAHKIPVYEDDMFDPFIRAEKTGESGVGEDKAPGLTMRSGRIHPLALVGMSISSMVLMIFATRPSLDEVLHSAGIVTFTIVSSLIFFIWAVVSPRHWRIHKTADELEIDTAADLLYSIRRMKKDHIRVKDPRGKELEQTIISATAKLSNIIIESGDPYITHGAILKLKELNDTRPFRGKVLEALSSLSQSPDEKVRRSAALILKKLGWSLPPDSTTGYSKSALMVGNFWFFALRLTRKLGIPDKWTAFLAGFVEEGYYRWFFMTALVAGLRLLFGDKGPACTVVITLWIAVMSAIAFKLDHGDSKIGYKLVGDELQETKGNEKSKGVFRWGLALGLTYAFVSLAQPFGPHSTVWAYLIVSLIHGTYNAFIAPAMNATLLMVGPAGRTDRAALVIETLKRIGYKYEELRPEQISALAESIMSLPIEEMKKKLADRRSREFADFIIFLEKNICKSLSLSPVHRYPGQEEDLRKIVLPKLIDHKRAANDMRIKITSLGTSVGNDLIEAGKMIRSLLGEDLSNWTITLEGRDMFSSNLDVFKSKARKELPESSFIIHPVLTLLGDPADQAEISVGNYDIIIFRNVGQYLSAQVNRDLVGKLNARFMLLDEATRPPAGRYEKIAENTFERLQYLRALAMMPFVLVGSERWSFALMAGIAVLFVFNKIGPIRFDILKNFVKEASRYLFALVERHDSTSSIMVSEKNMASALSDRDKTKPLQDLDYNRRSERRETHLDILISWIPTKRSFGIFFSTSIQSKITSLILLSSVGIVLACVWQPLSDVAVAMNMPSSSCSITMGNSYLRIFGNPFSDKYSLFLLFSQGFDQLYVKLYFAAIISAVSYIKFCSSKDAIISWLTTQGNRHRWYSDACPGLAYVLKKVLIPIPPYLLSILLPAAGMPVAMISAHHNGKARATIQEMLKKELYSNWVRLYDPNGNFRAESVGKLGPLVASLIRHGQVPPLDIFIDKIGDDENVKTSAITTLGSINTALIESGKEPVPGVIGNAGTSSLLVGIDEMHELAKDLVDKLRVQSQFYREYFSFLAIFRELGSIDAALIKAGRKPVSIKFFTDLFYGRSWEVQTEILRALGHINAESETAYGFDCVKAGIAGITYNEMDDVGSAALWSAGMMRDKEAKKKLEPYVKKCRKSASREIKAAACMFLSDIDAEGMKTEFLEISLKLPELSSVEQSVLIRKMASLDTGLINEGKEPIYAPNILKALPKMISDYASKSAQSKPLEAAFYALYQVDARLIDCGKADKRLFDPREYMKSDNALIALLAVKAAGALARAFFEYGQKPEYVDDLFAMKNKGINDVDLLTGILIELAGYDDIVIRMTKDPAASRYMGMMENDLAELVQKYNIFTAEYNRMNDIIAAYLSAITIINKAMIDVGGEPKVEKIYKVFREDKGKANNKPYACLAEICAALIRKGKEPIELFPGGWDRSYLQKDWDSKAATDALNDAFIKAGYFVNDDAGAKVTEFFLEYEIPFDKFLLEEYFNYPDAEAFIAAIKDKARKAVENGFNPNEYRESLYAYIGAKMAGILMNWDEYNQRMNSIKWYEHTAKPGSTFADIFKKPATLRPIKIDAGLLRELDTSDVVQSVISAHVDGLAGLKSRIDSLLWLNESFPGHEKLSIPNLYFQMKRDQAAKSGAYSGQGKFTVPGLKDIQVDEMLRELMTDKAFVYKVLFQLLSTRVRDPKIGPQALQGMRDIVIAKALDRTLFMEQLTMEKQPLSSRMQLLRMLYEDFVRESFGELSAGHGDFTKLQDAIKSFSAGFYNEYSKVHFVEGSTQHTFLMVPVGFLGIFQGWAGLVDCSFDMDKGQAFMRALSEDARHYFIYRKKELLGYVNLVWGKNAANEKVLTIDVIQSPIFDGEILVKNLLTELYNYAKSEGAVGIALPRDIWNSFNFPNMDTIGNLRAYREGQSVFLRPLHEESWMYITEKFGRTGTPTFISHSMDSVEFVMLNMEPGKEPERFDLEKGRLRARDLIARLSLSPEKAKAILKTVNKKDAFDWRYEEWGTNLKSIMDPEPGLKGFLKNYQRLGHRNRWSLMYHAKNNDWKGDVLPYAQYLLDETPGLEPMKDALDWDIRKGRKYADIREKVNFDLSVIGFLDELYQSLKEKAKDPKPAANDTTLALISAPLVLWATWWSFALGVGIALAAVYIKLNSGKVHAGFYASVDRASKNIFTYRRAHQAMRLVDDYFASAEKDLAKAMRLYDIRAAGDMTSLSILPILRDICGSGTEEKDKALEELIKKMPYFRRHVDETAARNERAGEYLEDADANRQYFLEDTLRSIDMAVTISARWQAGDNAFVDSEARKIFGEDTFWRAAADYARYFRELGRRIRSSSYGMPVLMFLGGMLSGGAMFPVAILENDNGKPGNEKPAGDTADKPVERTAVQQQLIEALSGQFRETLESVVNGKSNGVSEKLVFENIGQRVAAIAGDVEIAKIFAAIGTLSASDPHLSRKVEMVIDGINGRLYHAGIVLAARDDASTQGERLNRKICLGVVDLQHEDGFYDPACKAYVRMVGEWLSGISPRWNGTSASRDEGGVVTANYIWINIPAIKGDRAFVLGIFRDVLRRGFFPHPLAESVVKATLGFGDTSRDHIRWTIRHELKHVEDRMALVGRIPVRTNPADVFADHALKNDGLMYRFGMDNDWARSHRTRFSQDLFELSANLASCIGADDPRLVILEMFTEVVFNPAKMPRHYVYCLELFRNALRDGNGIDNLFIVDEYKKVFDTIVGMDPVRLRDIARGIYSREFTLPLEGPPAATNNSMIPPSEDNIKQMSQLVEDVPLSQKPNTSIKGNEPSKNITISEQKQDNRRKEEKDIKAFSQEHDGKTYLEQEKNMAVDFRDKVIEHGLKINELIAGQADEGEVSSQRVIIALGTGWIPGYKEKNVAAHYNSLNDLIRGGLRRFCQKKGIPFIDKDESELADAISAKKSEADFKNAKVIVLASADMLEAINNSLSKIENIKNPVLLGVDGSKLTEKSYIQVVEMLKVLLIYGLNPDIDPRTLTKIHMEEKYGFWIFLPEATPIEYDAELDAIYAVQLSA